MTPAGIRKIALRIVLGLLVLATVYGLYEGKLFQQPIWLPSGWRRFLLFAAVYTAAFTIFSLWKPSLFAPTIGIVVLVYSVMAVGPLALLSVGLFLLSSAVLGQRILGSKDGILAMLVGVCIYMFAASIAVHAPINYPAVYLLALFAPLAWNWRSAIDRLLRIPVLFRPVRFELWSSYAALAALLFVLLSHWLLTLEPEIAPDALSMHLGIPESVAMFHKWAFDVKQAVWAVMPMGADWCFTIVNLLGGEAAARLLNFAFLLAIVALLYSAARKWLPPGPALLMVAMFAATPVVQLVTCSLFSENLWAALAFASVLALVQYRERHSERLFYGAFVLLGGAAATKYGALAFLAPAIPIALAVRWRRPRVLRAMCGAMLVFLFFAAPPYLSAYVKIGNPVYPFLSSSSRTPSAAANFPLTPRAPYDLTFYTSRLPEVQDGAAGFQYFLFLPLALVLLAPLPNGPRALANASVLAAFLFAILTMRIQPHLRYLYPAFALATVVLAATFGALRTIDRPLYKVALALSAAVFFLNLYFLPSADWFHKDYYVAAGSASARTQYLADHAPVRNLTEYLNRAHPGKPVAFFETNATAGLRGAAFTNSWHTPTFNTQLSSTRSPEDYLHLMRQYGVQYLIAPATGSGTPLNTTIVETFLARCTAAEYRSGGFYLASLGQDDGCASRAGPEPPPAPAGQYDDRDPRILYERAWGRSRFPQTFQGTLTASNSTGAMFQFSFSGAVVTYVYTKAFNRGIAEISIDGASQGDLDLYTAATIWQARTEFACGQPGPHTLLVRVSGRKNPAASDTFVDIDALVVR